MSNLRYKVVTFLPDAPQPSSPGNGGSSGGGDGGDSGSTQQQRLALQLSGPWTWSVGLEPNTNSATISYLEFDKLGGVVGDVAGRIEFWYTQTPGGPFNADSGPDVSLPGWKIIDVEASKIGDVFVGGVLTHRIVEYKLIFQDARWQFVNPRGGRLRLGLINAGTKPDQDGPIYSDVPEMALDELIVACLTAMGIPDTNFPDDVANTDAPRDIKWYGNHAPTELAKLLELAGCVFCPQDILGYKIQTIVTSGDPDVTAADGVLPEITLPIIDRRGKTVIVASHPNANCVTLTMQGPQDDQWQFVCHDSQGVWQTYKNCDLLTGTTMLAAFQSVFVNLPANATKFANRLLNEAYRFIRLGDGTGGSSGQTTPQIGGPNVAPVLTQMIEADSSLNPISVEARIAVVAPDGTATNSTGMIPIAAQFKADENVLQLAKPLIQVSGGTDYFVNAQELKPGDFTVRYSTVQLHQDSEGRWVPTFFAAGFQRQAADANGNTLYQMTDAEVANALDGGVPDAVIIDRPDLRLLLNSSNPSDVGSFTAAQPVNKDDLISAAQTIADKALANSSDPTRIIRAKGFAAVVLDGLVSEVQWDQAELLTTATANNWYRPTGALSLTQWRREERADAEQFPKQAETQEKRVALGEPGATRAFMAVMPTDAPQPAQAEICTGGDPAQIPQLLAGYNTPDTTTFDRFVGSGVGGCEIIVSTGSWWNPATGQLNQNYRLLQFDSCGKLFTGTQEYTVLIDQAVSCGG